ncbi:MAG: hypothetical protein V4553_11495 [Bacteroidota bacterium]
MRKIILHTLLLMLCASHLSAQKSTCNFLGPLHFKNGRATVIVKARYTLYTASNDPYILERLSKKKILDGKKYYNVDFKGEGSTDATDIDFIPTNCQTSYYATVAKSIALKKLRWMQTVYLKCTVYQGIKNEKNEPYFTVDDITYTPKDIPRIDDAHPLIYMNNPPNDGEHPRYFTNAEPNNYLLYTTSTIATIQTADHKYHRFNFVKHTENRNGYVDLYKNGNESLELNIDHIFDKGAGPTTIATGTLTVILGGSKISFKIAGLGDDVHRRIK